MKCAFNMITTRTYTSTSSLVRIGAKARLTSLRRQLDSVKFDDIFSAFVVLFRVMVKDNWMEAMWYTQDGYNHVWVLPLIHRTSNVSMKGYLDRVHLFRVHLHVLVHQPLPRSHDGAAAAHPSGEEAHGAAGDLVAFVEWCA